MALLSPGDLIERPYGENNNDTLKISKIMEEALKKIRNYDFSFDNDFSRLPTSRELLEMEQEELINAYNFISGYIYSKHRIIMPPYMHIPESDFREAVIKALKLYWEGVYNRI